MGVLTEFFVASEDELKMVFDGWLPVASEKHVVGTNRQTGKIFYDWGPDPDALKRWQTLQAEKLANRAASGSKVLRWLDRLFGPSSSYNPYYNPMVDFSMLPHACFKAVTLTCLADLYSDLTGIQYDEAREQIEKPVLISPWSEDEGLYCLPQAFTEALVELDTDSINQMAKRWFPKWFPRKRFHGEESEESEESEEESSDEASGEYIFETLAELATAALKYDKNLYHWWSL
jgi:hypothetical protein